MENSREEVLKKHGSILDAPHPETSFPVKIQERTSPYTDVCSADVSTEWFMHTNAHHIASDVNLLFTPEVPVSRPVIPFTPAESTHCQSHLGCQESEMNYLFSDGMIFYIQCQIAHHFSIFYDMRSPSYRTRDLS